jgi:hypothetical protein
MTALSIAYPIVTLGYFWHDWFKYVKRGIPLLVGPAGFAIPVSEWMLTVLSPWRVLTAVLTAKLLFSSAKKLREGARDGGAMSMLTLLGVVLPQAFWYFEFVNDWNAGRGLIPAALAMLAATVLPAMALQRGDGALSGWERMERGLSTRVMASAIGLGWLATAAMSLVDHAYQLRHGMGAYFAALVTIPLAALAMKGLFRQRTWGMLAGMGAVTAAGASAVSLADAQIVETGTAMDRAFGLVAGSPTAAAAVPSVVLMALLAPFVLGMLKSVTRPAGGAAFDGASTGAGAGASAVSHRASGATGAAVSGDVVMDDVIVDGGARGGLEDRTFVRVESVEARSGDAPVSGEDMSVEVSAGEIAHRRAGA